MSEIKKQENSCQCHPIGGVRCQVHNCKYNVDDCFCTAGEIRVGPKSACTCDETVCATFQPQ